MNAVGMAPAPTTATSPRPRSRGFSFRSDRSAGSKSKDNSGLTESPQEKQRRDTLWKSSKANPNAALTESQPACANQQETMAAAVASRPISHHQNLLLTDLPPPVANLLEDTTIQSLRGVQHKDASGNVITDPDLSNPTRPRLERPLDTIRSFERAIDHGYRRRTSYNRAESYTHENNSQSRRNSYYGDNNNGAGGPNRQSQGGGGYYAGGPQQRDSYASNGGPNGSTPRVMRQGPGPRQASDSGFYGGRQQQHPQHAHQPSQDTDHTTSSNSGDNSSAERISQSYPNNNGGGPTPGGFNGGIPEEGGAYPFPGGGGEYARRPIPLGNTVSAGHTSLPPSQRPEPEKRKSWLQRRFSKKE